MRVYNERLILSLVRRFGQLSKIEVARMTGLSVQSTSTIMNRLQTEGLLRREAPLRGRVGQPTVPVSLDPEGAFSIGLKIGRRSCDLVLIDFCGHIRRRAQRLYLYPTPALVTDFVAEELEPMIRSLTPAQRRRIAGLGVAAPFQLWSWSSEIDAPKQEMDAWRTFSIVDELAKLSQFPVTLCNDATSACAAELFFGESWRRRDFLYFFVGTFIGGGLVIDGALFPGRTGNAAAVGSMPIATTDRNGDATSQLIDHASIYQLERRIAAAGRDPSSIWRTPEKWDDFGPLLEEWIDRAAFALAYATVTAISVIDVQAVIIDGVMPKAVRERLTLKVAQKVESFDRRGLSDVTIAEGAIGADARAIGGAALPLIKTFARDREVLFKDALTESA
ncbi:MAG: ROK family transcriptional regulator [Bradyrhizobium sp.]|nr:MAG: ROK family transcriptional regulator [Bradyrhizobium sp.]